jgi:pyruvate kinase
LYKDVKPGDTLLLDDGLISLKVDAIDATTIRTTVLVGGALSDRKGINRLGGGLSLTALAEKDKLDIRLAAKLDADFLAISFAKSAADIRSRSLLRAAARKAALVAKIRRAEAIVALAESSMRATRGHSRAAISASRSATPTARHQKEIIRETLARNRS